MLAAACAVGVSSCFGSPIGGMYSAVHNELVTGKRNYLGTGYRIMAEFSLSLRSTPGHAF